MSDEMNTEAKPNNASRFYWSKELLAWVNEKGEIVR
jgi:hypothetical protein